MTQISWRDVAAPDFSNSLSATKMSSDMLNQGLAQTSAALKGWTDNQSKEASNQLMAKLMGYTGDPARLNADMANGSFMQGYDPKNLTPEAIAAIGARQQDLQNFQLTGKNVQLAGLNIDAKGEQNSQQQFLDNEQRRTVGNTASDDQFDRENANVGTTYQSLAQTKGVDAANQYWNSPEVMAIRAKAHPGWANNVLTAGNALDTNRAAAGYTRSGTDVNHEAVLTAPVNRAETAARTLGIAATTAAQTQQTNFNADDRKDIIAAANLFKDVLTRTGNMEQARTAVLARDPSGRVFANILPGLEGQYGGSIYGVMKDANGHPLNPSATPPVGTPAAPQPAAPVAPAAVDPAWFAQGPAPTGPSVLLPKAAPRTPQNTPSAFNNPVPAGAPTKGALAPGAVPITGFEDFLKQNPTYQPISYDPSVGPADGQPRAQYASNFSLTPDRLDGGNPSASPAVRMLNVAAVRGLGGAPTPQNDPIRSYIQRAAVAESGVQGDGAQNTRSSAGGRYQFLNSTFRKYYADVYGQKLAGGVNDPVPASLKYNPQIQERLMQAFTTDNAHALQAAHVPVNDTTLYMAHHFGSGGAIQMINDPTGRPPAAVVKANPQFAGMNNGQALRWAADHFNGGGNSGQGVPNAGSYNPTVNGSNPIANLMTPQNTAPSSPFVLAPPAPAGSSPSAQANAGTNPLMLQPAGLNPTMGSQVQTPQDVLDLLQQIKSTQPMTAAGPGIQPSTNVAALLARRAAMARAA